jgi:hypothetical protein
VDHRLPVRAAAPDDLDRLRGVREPQPGGHRGDLQGASLCSSVTTLAGIVRDRDLPPWQRSEPGVQVRLVPLHGQHVVRLPLLDEVLGVRALGVYGIGGQDRAGDVDAVQKCCEHGDFVGLGFHVDLAQDHPVDVVERGQQMPSRAAGDTGSAQGLPVDGDPAPVGA